VPAQLLVRTPKGGNKPTALPHGTSLFDVRYAMPKDSEVVERDGLRLFSVPAVRGVNYFRRSATTISAGEGLAKELAGDRSGAR
jgi:hypothetical protein